MCLPSSSCPLLLCVCCVYLFCLFYSASCALVHARNNVVCSRRRRASMPIKHTSQHFLSLYRGKMVGWLADCGGWCCVCQTSHFRICFDAYIYEYTACYAVPENCFVVVVIITISPFSLVSRQIHHSSVSLPDLSFFHERNTHTHTQRDIRRRRHLSRLISIVSYCVGSHWHAFAPWQRMAAATLFRANIAICTHYTIMLSCARTLALAYRTTTAANCPSMQQWNGET